MSESTKEDATGATFNFEKVAEVASKVLSEQSLDPEFNDNINDVLKSLNDCQEAAASNPFSADQLSGIFQNMDINGADSETFMPFMQNMMQSLLSAEILLPSLKELVEKYPSWLKDNDDKLCDQERENYNKQLKLMKEVVYELEKEKSTDSSETKRIRFNAVLENMSKMQELGQPPAELVDCSGHQNVPNIDGDCSVM